MVRKRILVVEDDAGIRQGIIDALEYAGYHVYEAPDGDRGLEKALRLNIDLLLLDLVLPGRAGLEILRALRSSKATVPVIILTARGEEEDRVCGLQVGADDYVVKPFSVKELLARIEAVLRRSAERPEPVREIELADGRVDFERREVLFRDGSRAELSEREYELLRYLACRAGRAVSREEILARLWGIPDRAAVETRTVDMHIARLREKLRDPPSRPRVLLTVRGKGYMFAKERDGS